MRRLTVVLMGAVLLLAGCGSEPKPTVGRVSDGPPAPTVMEVTCAEDGSTKVVDSEVTVEARSSPR